MTSTPSTRHESAVGHVTGRAAYTDEQHAPRGLASLYPVQAKHAHHKKNENIQGDERLVE